LYAGQILTIYGSSFSDNSTVTVGGNDCPYVFYNDTLIQCILPDGQGSNQPVIVSVLSALSNSVPFSYNTSSCASNPCQNGATCLDGISPFFFFVASFPFVLLFCSHFECSFDRISSFQVSTAFCVGAHQALTARFVTREPASIHSDLSQARAGIWVRKLLCRLLCSLMPPFSR
jgi:hypothetical protein